MVNFVVSKKYIAMTVKGFFKGIWEVFKYLFLTPSWGSKRRAEQRRGDGTSPRGGADASSPVYGARGRFVRLRVGSKGSGAYL